MIHPSLVTLSLGGRYQAAPKKEGESRLTAINRREAELLQRRCPILSQFKDYQRHHLLERPGGPNPVPSVNAPALSP